jgi:hypothetical protein
MAELDPSTYAGRPTPFIFKLPNEVLHKIFSFLPGLDVEYWSRWYVKDGYGNHRALQMLTLMSVSRRFRMVALEAEFWIAEEFDFDSLFPPYVNADYAHRAPETGEIWLAKMNRIRSLLKDETISRRLGAKTRWRFTTTYFFEFAMLDIPHFRQTVREVKLPAIDVNKLSLCSCITKLTLYLPMDIPFDLGQIHKSCPVLEHLELSGVHEYSGTLHDLCSLQSLRLTYWDGDELHQIHLVPLNSKSTLTSLCMHVYEEMNPEALQALSAFSNLRYLELGRFTGEICECISELSSKLETVIGHFYMDSNPLQNVVRMLFSESLSRLTSLNITVEDGDPSGDSADIYKEYCCSILQTITLRLRFLEEFAAKMYLDPAWCQMLPTLRNLKRLDLKFYCLTEEDHDPELVMRLSEYVRKSFDGLEEKPVISVGWGFTFA